MKKRKLLWGAYAGMLIGVFLAGCTPSVDTRVLPYSSNATITRLSIAGEDAILGTPHEDWISDKLKPGVVVLDSTALSDAAVEVTASESGVFVYYAKTQNIEAPNFVEEEVFDFSDGDYLYVEVVSPNQDAVLFYKIQVLVPSDVAEIDRIEIGGASGTRGTPASTWNDAGLVAGAVNLTIAQAENSVIDISLANLGAKIEYAKVTGAGEPAFSEEKTFTFAQGDFLYIKVTSSDTTETSIYKILVNVGNVATLSSLSIGGFAPNMSVPAPALGDITDVRPALFKIVQPADGFDVVARVTSNADAVVSFARAAGDAAPEFGAVSKFVFNDRDYLYVKVAAANGSVTNIYKWQIFLLNAVEIPFGSPTITTNATPGTVDSLTIDSLWGSVEWLPEINRIAERDSIPEYIAQVDTSGISTHTRARAKMMWDLEGIYLYVEVTDDDVNTSNVGGSNQAWWDSVEFCINENIGYFGGSYETWGGLYRKGYGAGNNTVSGGPAAAITAFNALGKHASGKTSTGYAVILQAPWRFNNLDNEWGPAQNGKKIGLDIVIDDSRGTGGNTGVGNANGRRGVIAWNNSFTASAMVDNSAVITLAGAPTNIISDLVIGGVHASSLGTPAAAWSNAVEGAILFTPEQAGQAAVSVARLDPNYASVRYALVNGDSAPVFGVNNNLNFTADGSFLYLEVSAPGQPINIYKVRVNIKKNNANLTGITLGGVSLDPLPTPAAVWASAPATVLGLDATALSGGITPVVVKDDTDATVKYGVTATADGAVTWGTTPVTVTTGDYVGIQVTAEDGVNVLYYKIRIRDTTKSALATLTGITISGRPEGPASFFGPAVYLTSAQAAPGADRIVLEGLSSGATVRYGIGAFMGATTWADTQQTNAYAAWSTIIVELTSEDKCTVSTYQFMVNTENSAALSDLSVGGVTVSNLGTPSGSWNHARLVAGTVTLTSAEATDAALSAAANGTNPAFKYAKVTGTGAPAFAAAESLSFADGDILYIEVTVGNYVNIYKNVVTVSG